jgi:hypothetical protein
MAERPGVALLAFSNQSSHGARASRLIDFGRRLRRRGVPCKLLQVHLHPKEAEVNRLRLASIEDRLRSGGYSWVVAYQFWSPELAARIASSGARPVEMVGATEGVVLLSTLGDAPFSECETGQPLDEDDGLVEVVGQDESPRITNVDLLVGAFCRYERPLKGNPFYSDLADEFEQHRGCAHCLNAMAEQAARSPVTADKILTRVRRERAAFPGLKTLWLPFVEGYFDEIGAALDAGRCEGVWRGLSLAAQFRPDVVARRSAEIERLAARAEDCGTNLSIMVVGYENFSKRELEVLNRGTEPSDLVEAASIARRWKKAPPCGLSLANCTPSFILFTPWTRIEDLELNLRQIELNGLGNANIERLRAGPGTPVYEKARRMGLLSDGPVRYDVHPNGYGAEREILFADPRTAEVSAGFERLKSLAFEDQVELLGAVLRAVMDGRPGGVDWEEVARSWLRLRVSVQGPEPAARASAGRDCNNGCRGCIWTRRVFERSDSGWPVEVRGGTARLAGREPSLLGDLPGEVRSLRAAGAARVQIETNARRLADEAYLSTLLEAGIDLVAVKLFGSNAASWDSHTRVQGSFAQTLRGLTLLHQRAPALEKEAVLVPRRDPGAGLDALLGLADRLGFRRIRVALRLAKQDLRELPALERGISRLQSGPSGHRIRWEVS